MRAITCAALAAAAAACSPEGEPAANQAEPGISYENQLAAMPEGQRNAVFIRAIRDAGLDCQHVDSSTAGDDYRGMPVWNVRCSGGGNWTVVVSGDGIAQILNANEAALLRDDAGNGQ